jgi:hypothetical protein
MPDEIQAQPAANNAQPAAPPAHRISSIRISADRATTTQKLGLIAELSGTWTGQGFNLIARPDFENQSPLFLQLNHTFEKLSIVPISSKIPNRGSAVDDITLFGLTYLQEVFDINTQGALHIEPGIWIHVPSQDESVGVPPIGPKQSVARMGNIPHGTSILLEGSAFTAPPFTPDRCPRLLPRR